MGAEDRHVTVQVLALEGVGDHGLVLHADQVVEACLAQGQDGAFELPGGGVGAGHGEMPGDVVLEDRGQAGLERLRSARQLEQALIVVQHGGG